MLDPQVLLAAASLEAERFRVYLEERHRHHQPRLLEMELLGCAHSICRSFIQELEAGLQQATPPGLDLKAETGAMAHGDAVVVVAGVP